MPPSTSGHGGGYPMLSPRAEEDVVKDVREVARHVGIVAGAR